MVINSTVGTQSHSPSVSTFVLQLVFFLPNTSHFITIFFFHIQILWIVPICNIWHICEWKWLFLVTIVNGNTIHMNTIHSVIALASASFTTPSFHLATKLHYVVSWIDSWSFVWPLHRLLCCVLLFYMNTANKDKGKLCLCSWHWHIWGGTALQFTVMMMKLGGRCPRSILKYFFFLQSCRYYL